MMRSQESDFSFTAWEQTPVSPRLIKVFFLMCRTILFKPVEFFAHTRDFGQPFDKRRLGRALAFAFLLGYIKLACDAGTLLWLAAVSKKIPTGTVYAVPRLFSAQVMTSSLFLLRPIILFSVTVLLVMAGIKLVLGFDRKVFPAVLVISYKSAAELFYCIPVFGGMLAFGWSVMLLLVGIREAYRVPSARAFFAGIMLPFLLLLSVFVSVGPSLNRAILLLYPEARPQMIKLNDMAAYATMTAIISACREYKEDLGFYPQQPGVLKKYLSASVIAQMSGSVHRSAGGYLYEYTLADEEHFSVRAEPIVVGETGHFSFYGDETGKVRLSGPQGEVVEDTDDLEHKAGEMVLEPAAF